MTRVQLALFADATDVVLGLAKELRAFEQAGVALDVRHVADADEAHAALFTGTADIAGMSFDDVLTCALSGHRAAPEVRVLLPVHRGFSSLMARPDVASVEALRGRRLAVDTYTGYASALFEVLQRHGVDAERDCEVLLAGATDRRFRALLGGAFDATLLGTPFDLLAERAGMRRLIRPRQTLDGYLGVVIAARTTWLAERRAAADAFTRTFRETLQIAMADPHDALVHRVLDARFGKELQTTEALDGLAAALFGPESDFVAATLPGNDDVAAVVRLYERHRHAKIDMVDALRLFDVPL
ncbi:MAG: ABC transporter substrate-binding protein [Pseudomonadota bacterium]